MGGEWNTIIVCIELGYPNAHWEVHDNGDWTSLCMCVNKNCSTLKISLDTFNTVRSGIWYYAGLSFYKYLIRMFGLT